MALGQFPFRTVGLTVGLSIGILALLLALLVLFFHVFNRQQDEPEPRERTAAPRGDGAQPDRTGSPLAPVRGPGP